MANHLELFSPPKAHAIRIVGKTARNWGSPSKYPTTSKMIAKPIIMYRNILYDVRKLAIMTIATVEINL